MIINRVMMIRALVVACACTRLCARRTAHGADRLCVDVWMRWMVLLFIDNKHTRGSTASLVLLMYISYSLLQHIRYYNIFVVTSYPLLQHIRYYNIFVITSYSLLQHICYDNIFIITPYSLLQHICYQNISCTFFVNIKQHCASTG